MAYPIYVPILAGLLGVAVLTFFVRRARFIMLPETDMVRAIGSLITKNYENALIPGAIAHIFAGIVFAFAYAFALNTAPSPEGSAMVIIVVCSLIGLVHGIMVTLFLVISVAQYHPLERFRKLNGGDMAAHVISHLAYGATVGATFAFVPQWLA